MQIKVNLRDIRSMQQAVCSTRNAAMVPEVQHALTAWIKQRAKNSGVLIGGLAMSFYSKPRYTEDADFLFLSDEDIPDQAVGFKRTRKGAFENQKTGVEVEVCTPASINLPHAIAQKVFATALDYDGVRVASIEGLIALKLVGSEVAKRHHRDLGDIQTLIESNRGKDLSLSDWPITAKQRQQLQQLIEADMGDQ